MVSELEIAVPDRPCLPDAAPGATIVCMNPKRTSRAVAVVCSVLIGLMGAACAGQPDIKPAAAPDASLWPLIQAQVGTGACDSQDQCRTIGVGSKACGGPSGYLAWSSKGTDPAALKALVERHALAQREQDRRSGINSDCSMATDPGASCVATPSGGRCQLNDGRAGAQ